MGHLKFRPELVPKPLWGLSAYRTLGRGAKWRAIRNDVLKAASNQCSACECSESPLYCHEEWKYDDKCGIAELVGFGLLCENCNNVAHIGRAMAHGLKNSALEHLCRINGLTKSEGQTVVGEAMKVWRARNRKKWRVTVSKSLLGRYPYLRLLLGAATRQGK